MYINLKPNKHKISNYFGLKFLAPPPNIRGAATMSGRLLLGEDIVLIILQCNGKCGSTAKLNIYYPFVIALILIRSHRRKRKKIKHSSRWRFWIWPLLFADRVTRGTSTNWNYLSLLVHLSLASKQQSI